MNVHKQKESGKHINQNFESENNRPLGIRQKRSIIFAIIIIFPVLITAIAAYFILNASEIAVAEFEFPLIFENIPQSLIKTGPTVSDVRVKLRGPEKLLQYLKTHPAAFKIDLSSQSSGENTVSLGDRINDLPKNVRILQIQPSQITLKFGKRMKKKLPVEVILEGKPASGYQVAGAVSQPLSIDIEGPQSVVETLRKIETKPIDISGIKETIQKDVAMVIPEGILIGSDANIIQAKVFIDEILETRQFEGVQVTGKNSTFDYRITPPTIQIDIKGPASLLDNLESRIEVYVDLEGLDPGMYARRATISLPVETTLVGAHPEVFTVVIENN